jgi:molecular chaperone DnaK (HSP70)
MTMASKKIFGIDLGTTYSCISYVDDSGKPVVVPNAEGDLTTPSVVYFESKDNIVVGKQAKNSSKVYPDRVAAFVKRFMGNPNFALSVDGKEWKPEEISSLVLRKLVGDAGQTLGESISDVVITCPAYFGINEREATKNAGKLAGLEVRHILNEPTAAAICYGVEKKGDSVVLVYDLGGGTFDITVIAIRSGAIQVIYTDGNHTLGGKDWDDRITNYLSEQFMKEYPDAGDPRDDPESLQEIALAAEEAKKGLSSRDKWPQTVTHKGFRSRVELTRTVIEEITADLLEQTITLTETALREAKSRGYPKIDQLLLVGGSSRMPVVQRVLLDKLGLEGQLFEPDQAVAKGAALQGMHILAGDMIREEVAALTGTAKDDVDLADVDKKTIEQAAKAASARSSKLLRLPAKELAEAATRKIVNVASHSFGVVYLDDNEQKLVSHLIHAQSPVPAQKAETFATIQANQRTVHVQVMESKSASESPSLDDNKEICNGDLTDLPPNLPARSPIEVTFGLADDGTLDVGAVEPRSKRELKLKVKVEGVMSDDEVERSRSMLMKKAVS